MRILTILSIIGMLVLADCSGAGTQTAASGAKDSDLEQAIRAHLASDPDLLASDISVSASADKNTAILSGTVPSEAIRDKAVEEAKASKPGLDVTDNIQVKSTEMSQSQFTEDMARQAREKAKQAGDIISASLEDAWLYTKIMAKLAANPDTPARKINVDVTNGLVTLRGRVESAATKAAVERTAKEVDGVKRLTNLLRVQATD